MWSSCLHRLLLYGLSTQLQSEALQEVSPVPLPHFLRDARMVLPKLPQTLVLSTDMPRLRGVNSCKGRAGRVRRPGRLLAMITDPPYQEAPNLGRITDPPYQGAQTLLCQMRQASMTIANVISFKAAFSICKAGTRTTTKPRIHRQHLRLAEADSQKKIRKRWRQQACAEEDKERAQDTKRSQSSMSTGLFVEKPLP